MLWEVEIHPLGRDADRERVCDEFDLLTHGARGGDYVASSSKGFLLEGEGLNEAAARKLADALLVDAIVERTDLPAQIVLQELTFLSLRGLVKRVDGQTYARRR